MFSAEESFWFDRNRLMGHPVDLRPHQGR